MNTLPNQFLAFLPLVASLVIVGAVLYTAHWALLGKHPEMGNDRRLSRQLLLFILGLVGIIVIVLSLPVSESTRNQILALIGVVFSGIIAFSSTTIVANAMAGIMLRFTKPFRTGDFIRSGEFFGRVTERGLLDTEIQTEFRELISVPNHLLITNPVTVTRSSGTIVSATVSLGYDIHHSHIESLLAEAAAATGLEDPFIQIIELGDFSITYRINGLLTEIKNMLTVKSNLHKNILDALHSSGVEIVSPTFMNQRRLDLQTKFIPSSKPEEIISKESRSPAEQIMFDKAEQAERIENAVDTLRKEISSLEEAEDEAEGDEKARLSKLIDQKRGQLKKLESAQEEDQ